MSLCHTRKRKKEIEVNMQTFTRTHIYRRRGGKTRERAFVGGVVAFLLKEAISRQRRIRRKREKEIERDRVEGSYRRYRNLLCILI